MMSLFPERVIIRGYADGVLQFEDNVSLAMDGIENLAAKHMLTFGDRPFMIEIEFLDEKDPLRRFLRFGTDPKRMVVPLALPMKDYPD